MHGRRPIEAGHRCEAVAGPGRGARERWENRREEYNPLLGLRQGEGWSMGDNSRVCVTVGKGQRQ
jgi:hypothetical protein